MSQVVKALPVSTEKLGFIRKAIAEEKVCKKVDDFCLSCWPKHVDYDSVANITFKDGLLLNGSRMIQPGVLQQDMLEKIHAGHQGINKCRERAHCSFWWPGNSKDIKFLLIIAVSVHRIGYHQKNLCFLLKPRIIPGKKWHAIF